MLNNQLNYIYLHGFASSSQSFKAQKFQELFATKNIPLIIPDLNQNDFYNLNKVNITDAKRVYVSFENDTDTLVYTIS